jgi:hypothetical protein
LKEFLNTFLFMRRKAQSLARERLKNYTPNEFEVSTRWGETPSSRDQIDSGFGGASPYRLPLCEVRFIHAGTQPQKNKLFSLNPSQSPDSMAMKATMLEPEIITRKGKPVSVIIPIKDYEELLERVEDSEDAAWLDRARCKPLHYRPLEGYLAERNRK